ncbi:MAG: type II toxin-antitoxin system Phd/YefM family antitoxin [Candidatus Acidiferrum sp.]
MAKRRMKTARPIERIVTALTARTQFGQILRRVHKDKEKFVVQRRGESQAVILNVEEYLRLFAKPIPAVEAIRREAKAKGLDRITLREINREIKLARRELRNKKNG